MATAPSEESSIDIFFSYASENARTISEVLGDAEFGSKINGSIVEYKDRPILAASLSKGLEDLIVNCEIFVAFISEAYATKDTPQLEFNIALQLIARPTENCRLRELAFVVLDRKGLDWWKRVKKRAEITGWRSDPVWLNWMNDRGSRPRSTKTDPNLIDEIQDWAQQLRKQLKNTAIRDRLRAGGCHG